MNQPPRLLTITVSGNSGSVVQDLTGRAIGIGVKAPANAAYDILITDVDGVPLAGQARVTNNGYLSFDGSWFSMVTVSLQNATNGTYTCKIFYND